MNDIHLGTYKDKNVYYDTNEAMNGHITTTGKSGSGKSVFNQKLILQIAKNEGSVLAISIHGTLKTSEIFGMFREEFLTYIKTIDAYNEGLSCPLFGSSIGIYDDKERINRIGEVTEVISRAYDLKSRQTACLRKAVAEVYDRGGYHVDGVRAVADVLRDMDTNISENILEKMFMMFEHNVFRDGPFFLDRKKITITDLDGYDELTQHAVAEMILSYIWRMAVAGEFKKEKLHVFIDEAQNLSFAKGSTLEKMLTEGRKMGINLMLATQYVEKNSKMSKLLNQSDLQVFFHPARNEIRETASIIDPARADEWTVTLKALEVGEFVAVGPLKVDGICTRGPLRIDSRYIKGCDEEAMTLVSDADAKKSISEHMVSDRGKRYRRIIVQTSSK